jgi:multiple sugar transport system substrate-binding protein
MSEATHLRGMAWRHTRAIGPLRVTAQVFSDFRPRVELDWDARSLWAFGEASLEDIARGYDLVVLDHPMIGYAVERELLSPLDDAVPAQWLEDQAERQVGGSHDSYIYCGRQWAAAIDAACPVAAARDDLLETAGVRQPEGWSDMLSLARSTGRVAVPLKQIDALALFLGLCANQGESPLDPAGDCAVSHELGSEVLSQLRELLDAVGHRCLEWNPIDVLTRMASSDDLIFCPHLYGYSNYAREGFGRHRITFSDFTGPNPLSRAGVTLGGAGLAVSSFSAHQELAFEYLTWVASAECQRTTYALAGGQPGHSAAWDDDTVNHITHDFFRGTRTTIDGAFVRPRHAGMHEFQIAAGAAIHEFLKGSVDSDVTLHRLDEAFVASLPGAEG